MKSMMRGMGLVAALLLASVAGVAAQGVTADYCSVREWLLPLQQPLQDYGAVLTGLQTGIADIDDPEDPLALVGVMQTLQRANQDFIDEAAGIVEDCDLQVAVEDYLGSPVEPNPQVADIMVNLQLDQESGVAESCWRTPAGEALGAFLGRGLANVAVAEALAEEADAGNFDTPPDYLVVTYGAALAYNRALENIDFDCAAAGADGDGGQETRAQTDSAAQASVPTCGPAQGIVAAVDMEALAQLQGAAASAEQSAAMVALAQLLSQLEAIVLTCPDTAETDPDALADLTVDVPLKVYVWEDELLSGQLLVVSLESTFDIEEYDADVSVRAGVRSSDYLLGDAIFGGDPPVQLTGFEDEIRKDEITLITIAVGGLLDDKRHFRCELSEQQNEVDVYACTER